jgi:hypothetical protein
MNTAGYATDLNIESSLPIEMDYKLPASLPSAKNFEIRVQPVNAQSFIAGNVVQIDLPCGRRGQYLDPTTTYIRFKTTYVHGGTAATDVSRLMGSGYSPFIKQEVYGNNSVLLESINEVGVLASTMLNIQLNDSDKRGLSSSMGFDFTSGANAGATAGHRINNNNYAEGLVFEYAMPILGILGSGTNKMIPIGAFYGLRFELTMDAPANYVKPFAGAATANLQIQSATITEFEFVGNVIELSPEAQSVIEMANPQKIHIRSQTYRQATNQLTAASGAGTYDLLVGIRVSSLKSIFLCCSPANAAEGKYAGVNPNLDQGTCFVIAGQNYPQRGLNPSGHPSDCFTELQKALGALSFSVFNGAINKIGYYTSSQTYGLCGAYNAVAANIQTAPNQFFLGIDTEVVARKDSLLSGINVNSSPMFFRAQVGAALTNINHTLNFWGYYDVILEIDVVSKNIIAKF